MNLFSNDAVSFSNVSVVSSNNNRILKDINLTVKTGEFIAITGHNGAGKTSLFKLINNLIIPSKGAVKVFDKTADKSIKKLIGYVPQISDFDANIPISVRQAVEIGLTAKKGIFTKFTEQDKLFIENIAEKLDILNLLDKPIGKLSVGQMQKVSIARVLAQEAEIILFDEPLASLDTKSRKDVIKIMEDIYDNGAKTIMLITHNTNLIPECCKKIITLENGRIKN